MNLLSPEIVPLTTGVGAVMLLLALRRGLATAAAAAAGVRPAAT